MKAINDNFGHCSGDKLLVSLGSVITSSIRKDDFVFRFGGDEFVIVFPNADKEQATKIIRRNHPKRHRRPKVLHPRKPLRRKRLHDKVR